MLTGIFHPNHLDEKLRIIRGGGNSKFKIQKGFEGLISIGPDAWAREMSLCVRHDGVGWACP